MNLQDRAKEYLEYCTYRKELDAKTVKAYRIDLKQYFSFVCCDEPEKETIERYITNLHKKYKQKTVKRKIASVKAFYSYLEEEEVLGILTSAARNYLDYGGLFIFDLNTEYKYKEILGEQTIAENREEGSFIWENYYDEESMINEYDLTLFVKEPSGLYRKEEEHGTRI